MITESGEAHIQAAVRQQAVQQLFNALALLLQDGPEGLTADSGQYLDAAGCYLRRAKVATYVLPHTPLQAVTSVPKQWPFPDDLWHGQNMNSAELCLEALQWIARELVHTMEAPDGQEESQSGTPHSA